MLLWTHGVHVNLGVKVTFMLFLQILVLALLLDLLGGGTGGDGTSGLPDS